MVSGTADPGLGGVREAFADGFAARGERGGAVAVWLEGRALVDLWGGSADDAGRAWEAGTLVNVFSAGKPFAALCVLRLVDAGRIALDDPVARCWPAFAAGGKSDVTVRHVLAHQAGLDLFEQPLDPSSLLDWDRATTLLAGAEPRWQPGTTHGEHAAFYGHLLGEIVRRVDGRSLGTFFRQEIAEPWRLELRFGLDPPELPLVADVVDPDGAFRRDALTAGPAYRLALDNPPAMLDPEVVNGHAWRHAEIPAVNAHATARALARLYAGLAAGGTLDGVRLLSRELVAEAVAAPQRVGPDEVLGHEVGWGLGVQIDEEGYGMGGIGGSGGWWSADGYAFAYVTRRLGTHQRATSVEAAVREGLGLPPFADD